MFSGIIPLLAGHFENQLATATAWRWLAAVFLLGGSFVIWYRRDAESEALAGKARRVLFTLTVVPLILLTTLSALRAVFGSAVQTPISGVFSLFSNEFSYGVPLVLLALVLIGYALRERMPELACYAGICLNATVTLAFLLAVASAHAAMDHTVVVRLVQLNAITCAVYLLPWLATRRRRWQSKLGDADQRFADFLLKFQLFIAVALNALLLVWGLTPVVLMPEVEPS